MAEQGLCGGGGLGRPRLTLAALALSLVASGCYSYTEVSPAAVPPGSEVRVSVRPDADVGVGSDPLPDGPQRLRGRLMGESSAETLRLSVPVGRGEPGVATRQLRQTVSVPMADVLRVELRRFEKGRTAAAIAGGGVAAAIVTVWAFNVLDPSPGPSDGGGGGVDNARLVLFRLRW